MGLLGRLERMDRGCKGQKSALMPHQSSVWRKIYEIELA
jgi:hypothetical protein